jgi:hypothetical protein
MPHPNLRIGVLAAITVIALLVLVFVGPIPQDPSYHLFADARRMLGVANFWNVVSNIPFVVIGAFGLTRLSRLAQPETSHGYFVMCLGVLLVGFGSAYYHLAPSNESLLWDRLPMTVAFMALLSLVLGERVTQSYSQSCLWILVAAGVGSVLYWSWTEQAGQGDLRPYALVQFLPIILLPLIILMFRSRYLSNALLLSAFSLYIVAKALEHFDPQVFSALSFMGGHAIKHIAAAAAVLCIILAVPVRAERTYDRTSRQRPL